MSLSDNYIQEKFGIDEIYLHETLSYDLLQKLHQRSLFSIDIESKTVEKYAPCDMVLIFYKQTPSQSLIYRFLKFLDQYKQKEAFINSNSLETEDELFSAVKSKKYVLITPKELIKESYLPG